MADRVTAFTVREVEDEGWIITPRDYGDRGSVACREWVAETRESMIQKLDILTMAGLRKPE